MLALGRKRERDLDKLGYQRCYQRARYHCVSKKGYTPHSLEYKQCMKECMDEETKKEKTHFLSMSERLREQEQFQQERKAIKKEETEFGQPIFRSYDIVKQLPRGGFFEGSEEETTLDKERRIGDIVEREGGMDYNELMKRLGSKSRFEYQKGQHQKREDYTFSEKKRAFIWEITRDLGQEKALEVEKKIQTPQDLAEIKAWIEVLKREDEDD